MKICTEKTRRNFFYCLPVVHSLARLILFCLFTFSIPLAAGQFNRGVWLEGEYTCTFIIPTMFGDKWQFKWPQNLVFTCTFEIWTVPIPKYFFCISNNKKMYKEVPVRIHCILFTYISPVSLVFYLSWFIHK